MPVFEYTAANTKREDHVESGTIVAKTQDEAKKKLKDLRLGQIRLKRLNPIAGFLKSFNADVR